MSKRKKVSVIVSNNRHAFKHYRKVVTISGTTGGDGVIGVIYASIATTGIDAGNCYIAVDTSGTGTKINV